MKTNKSIPLELPVIPPKNSFILGDCMDYLMLFPPNFFDLAIVDPPYGQSWGNLYQITSGRTDLLEKHFDQARQWDIKPDKEYFDELKRISKKYIIWGYNYFTEYLGSTNDLIVWDKEITGNKNFLRFEIAYCSFNATNLIKARKESGEEKQHPTQKPLRLYRRLLKEYALAGDLILDTHVGSGSCLVACKELGFDYVGFEIDKEYYEMAKSRLGRATRKYELFEAV